MPPINETTCGVRGCGPTCGIKLTLLRVMSLIALAGVVGVVDSALRPFSVSFGVGPVSAPSAVSARPVAGSDTGTPDRRLDQSASAPSAAATAEATRVPGAQPAAPAEPVGEGFIDTDTAKTFHDRMFDQGDVTFVDARNADEFAVSHIPGSLHVPPDAFFGGSLPAALDLAPKSNTIVVYCGGGECDASKLVALRFKEQGYASVVVYQAGFTGWSAAKLPVQKGGG